MSTSTALSIPINDIERMAVAAAKSGLFGVKTPDQALALMLVAQAEGLHPAAAARDYHVIQGRPALKADALFARFQAAGGTVRWLKYQDDACRAVISHPQGGSVEIEWNIGMAERAGLTGRNPTWKTYPRSMLRSRVISEGVRAVFPGCASGVYTVEEVSDMTGGPAPISTVAAEPVLPRGAVGRGEGCAQGRVDGHRCDAGACAVSLARELKDLARAERKEMIDALVVVARDRAHTVGLDSALRAALDTAYDVGRMAVALEIFKRTLDGEVRRVGGTVQ